MEMFLFSKSIIPDENSVKISRRIFLDRSQGLKCTKKTSFFKKMHAALDSIPYIGTEILRFPVFLHNGNVFVFKINNRGGKLGQNFTAHLSR